MGPLTGLTHLLVQDFATDLFGPWLRIALVTIAISLACWLAVLPTVRRLRTELERVWTRIGQIPVPDETRVQVHLEGARDALQEALQAAERATRDQVAELGQQLIKRMDAAREQLAGLSTRIGELDRVLGDLRAECERVPPAIEEMDEGVSKLAPASVEEAVQDEQPPARFAWFRLFALTILLAVVIFVNTGMLSQILAELGFIPRQLLIISVPLYIVLALALTTVEAAVGLVIHIAKDRSGIPIFLIVVGGVICLVEGFFYSQVAPNKEALFELPFGLLTVRQQDLFFLWGCAIIAALITLGYFWHENLEAWLSYTSAAAARRRLRAIFDRVDETCGRAEATANRFNDAAKAVDHMKDSLEDYNKRAAEAVGELEKLREAPALLGHAVPASERVSLSRVRGLGIEVALEVFFSVVALVVSVAVLGWVSRGTVGWIVGAAGGLALWTLSSALAAHFGGRWTAERSLKGTARWWRGKWVWIGLLGGLVATGVLVMLGIPNRAARGVAVWAAIVLVALLMVANGLAIRRLALFPEFLPVAAHYLRVALVRAIQGVGWVLVGVISVVVIGLQYAALCGALPWLAIFKRQVVVREWPEAGK